MTEELRATLDREMEDALETKDPLAIARAQSNATKALCDCQMKTSDRVKKIMEDHDNLVADAKHTRKTVDELSTDTKTIKSVISQLKQEHRDVKMKFSGAKLMLVILRYAGTAGFGAGLLKILQMQ